MLTEEQLLQRKKGLGGSDIAAIYGISKYKTAFQVYQEKMGYALPQEMTDVQRHGHIMETVILDEYERITGLKLIRPTKAIFSKEYPWMLANLDAMHTVTAASIAGFSPQVIIDAKYISSFRKKEFGEPGTFEVPDDILLQMVHYAIVCDADKVDVAVFFDRPELFIYTYERDAELEADVIEKERNFWHEHILKGVPPELRTLEDIKIRWPRSKPSTEKMATEDAVIAYEELQKLKQEEKQLKARQATWESVIKREIQNFETLLDGSGNKLATWKTQITKRLDVDKLRDEYPHVYTQYLKESESRRFLLK